MKAEGLRLTPCCWALFHTINCSIFNHAHTLSSGRAQTRSPQDLGGAEGSSLSGCTLEPEYSVASQIETTHEWSWMYLSNWVLSKDGFIQIIQQSCFPLSTVASGGWISHECACLMTMSFVWTFGPFLDRDVVNTVAEKKHTLWIWLLCWSVSSMGGCPTTEASKSVLVQWTVQCINAGCIQSYLGR